MRSDFCLLGARVPDLMTCDFSADWRFNKSWPLGYFKQHSFYEEKDVPYDVKFPWELSRLHYLIPILASMVGTEIQCDRVIWILTFLQRWRGSNPLANSVNWYPMEASMRAVNLTVLLDLTGALEKSTLDEARSAELAELRELLYLMIFEHASFIWENREFTDVRGNHFTANIVALLLATRALESCGVFCRAWQRYALHWLDREIALQFCSDGVNFEKSCGYHKLVLELFLLAAIVRRDMGRPFSAGGLQLLRGAVRFSDAVSRPDGTGANFGDVDDAVALSFALDSPASHGPVVELGRAFFGESIGHVRFAESAQIATAFLLGRASDLPVSVDGLEVYHFPSGGYVVVRHASRGFFCMVDIGEVGMNGRGGHGHNDMLAFELWLGHRPVIVDPGCSGYTADLHKKTEFRRTGSHATVALLNDEMARITGHWRIEDDAIPTDVVVRQDGDTIVVSAAHDGYARLVPGTRITRTLTIEPMQDRIAINDIIAAGCTELVASWAFPLGANIVRVLDGGALEIDGRARLTSDLALSVGSGLFSRHYGHEVEGTVVRASTTLDKGRHAIHSSIFLH